jgi:thiol-disulfide isomerase/thioredoxin
MEDLYDDHDVIKLTDKDFDFSQSPPVMKNKEFRSRDGYLLFYAPFCPHCVEKTEFWSHLGREFNHNSRYDQDNFRIGVINTTDPRAEKTTKSFGIDSIPRFMHVTPNPNGTNRLTEYKGPDFSPESLVGEVCKSKSKLCRIDPRKM